MQFRFVQQSCAFFLQLFILSHLLHLGPLLVDAAPTGLNSYRTSVVRRQDGNNSQPTTVTTVTQVNTANGPVTETCKIKLTPITVDGQPQVEEVKDCTLSSDSGGGSSSAAGSDTTSIATSTIASSSAGGTSASGGSSSAAASTTGASATGGSGPIVNGLSSVSATLGSATAAGSASATASSSASQATSASGSVTSAASTGTASVSVSASSSSAASSAASAAATPAGAAAFTVPGKKLSVLPIGLGVFAGISVIALIVVGLVTYERTKYRKAFRQRKLAEQGGAMGYGGMVDRI